MSASFHHVKNRVPQSMVDTTPERPRFSSHNTSDRLAEADRKGSKPVPGFQTKKHRKSVFRELGLDDLEHTIYHAYNAPSEDAILDHTPRDTDKDQPRRQGNVTFDDILRDVEQPVPRAEDDRWMRAAWMPKLSRGARPMIKSSASAPPGGLPTLSRSALIVCLIAVCVPSFQYYGSGRDKVVVGVAEASPTMLNSRQNTDTAVCTRWANQGLYTP